jgi:serine protease Do
MFHSRGNSMSGLPQANLIRMPVRRATTVAFAAAALAMLAAAPGALAQSRGPASVADVAEKVLDAVVNISTSQSVGGPSGPRTVQPPQLRGPQGPQGSPFDDFFEEFFKRRGEEDGNRPRRVSSLGSGFVIDAEGIVITNNHVIADAD